MINIFKIVKKYKKRKFITELKSVKNQIDILKWENTISEIKNILSLAIN